MIWGSGGHRKLVTMCRHDFAMKYMIVAQANGRNIEKIVLSLSEILPVYFSYRLHQSVAVAGDKHLLGFRGP